MGLEQEKRRGDPRGGVGLTQDELRTIHRIPFLVMRAWAVMRPQEAGTWHDPRGRTVFTKAKGRRSVGPPPGDWKEARSPRSGTVRRTVKDTTLPADSVEREFVWQGPFTRRAGERGDAEVWQKPGELDKNVGAT